MERIALEHWVIIFGIIGVGLTCMLHTLSATLRDFRRAQKLKNDVEALRNEYADRLAALKLRAEMDAVSKKAA